MEKAQDLPKQPLAEVFGYPIDNFSQAAERHRRLHLCPFNNKVPNCELHKEPSREPYRSVQCL